MHHRHDLVRIAGDVGNLAGTLRIPHREIERATPAIPVFLDVVV